MTYPRWLLSIAFLAVNTTLYVSAQEETQEPTTDPVSNTTAPVSLDTMAPSFCDACVNTGDCRRAYQRRPGISCGHRRSASGPSLSCCCPADAVCVNKYQYICTCNKARSKSPATSSINRTSDSSFFSHYWTWICLYGLLIVIIIPIAVHRRRSRLQYVGQQPVFVPGHGVRYGLGYGHVYHDAGVSTRAGIAAGAAAGIVGGGAIADAGDHGVGASDFGGEGDFGGDFGGSGVDYGDGGFAGDF